MRTAAAVLLALSVLAGPAAAADTVRAGAIEIAHAWARPSVTANSAIYLEIENTGQEPDRLVAARTPAAAKAELHTHMMDGNIARMRPVDAIEVTPGSATVLRPGGLHIMLTRLKAPLKEGDSVALTLIFEKAGEVELEVPVRRNAGGMSPGHHGMQGHGGMHDKPTH
jgi:copper(I)-binding protein